MLKTNNSIVACLVSLALLGATAACDRKTVYDHYEHTPVAGWEKNDTLTFGPIKIDQTGDYRECVGLRINGTFPFQSLCLVVEQRIYPQGTIYVDTMNCRVVNRDGSERGEGVSYYQFDFDGPERVLNAGDSIYVYVRHNMKREILPGVSDVGIRITKR